jgi:hypothetical protein
MRCARFSESSPLRGSQTHLECGPQAASPQAHSKWCAAAGGEKNIHIRLNTPHVSL